MSEYNDVLLAWAGDEDAQSRVGVPMFRTYSVDPDTGVDTHVIYGLLLAGVLTIHVHVRRAPVNQRITLKVVRPDDVAAPRLSEIAESVEPYRCPTPCDPDCRAFCHEGHQPTHKQQHDRASCVYRATAAFREFRAGQGERLTPAHLRGVPSAPSYPSQLPESRESGDTGCHICEGRGCRVCW